MSDWMETVARGGRKLGVHDQGQLIQKTGESDAYGLRNVSRHAAENEKTEFPLQESWDSSHDNPIGPTGIREVKPPFTGTVSVVETVPDIHQAWDKD